MSLVKDDKTRVVSNTDLEKYEDKKHKRKLLKRVAFLEDTVADLVRRIEDLEKKES